MKSRQSSSSPKLAKKNSQSTFESVRTPNRIDSNEDQGAHIRYFKRTYPIRIYYPNSIEKQLRSQQTSSEAYLVGKPCIQERILAGEDKPTNANQVQQTHFCQQKYENKELKGMRSSNLRIANPITIQIQDVRKRTEVLFQRKMVDENKNEMSQLSRTKRELLMYIQKQKNYLGTMKKYEGQILELQKEICSLKSQNLIKEAQLSNYRSANTIFALQLERIRVVVQDSDKQRLQFEALYQQKAQKLKESEIKRELLEKKVEGLHTELTNLANELSRLHEQNQKTKKEANQKIDSTKFYEDQIRGRQRIQSHMRYWEDQTDLSIKSHRSASIQLKNGEAPKICFETTAQKNKYTRFVQTETCKLETALRQNEILLNMNKNKDKAIKNFQKEISALNGRLKKQKEIEQKNIENKKLISDLNEKIMSETAARLSSKYRFY